MRWPRNIMERGRTFRSLTTTGVQFHSGGRVLLLCACACGNYRLILRRAFSSGDYRDCGEHRVVVCDSPAWGKPEYALWYQMVRRCVDAGSPNYSWYGGKGIRVAPEWLHDFDAFLAHIGRRPSPLHSIDRINSLGNYAPGNVRWATPKQQARNRGTTKLTVEIASEIRGLYLKGGMFQREIAVLFGIHQADVSNIVNDKRWVLEAEPVANG